MILGFLNRDMCLTYIKIFNKFEFALVKMMRSIYFIKLNKAYYFCLYNYLTSNILHFLRN